MKLSVSDRAMFVRIYKTLAPEVGRWGLVKALSREFGIAHSYGQKIVTQYRRNSCSS